MIAEDSGFDIRTGWEIMKSKYLPGIITTNKKRCWQTEEQMVWTNSLHCDWSKQACKFNNMYLSSSHWKIRMNYYSSEYKEMASG